MIIFGTKTIGSVSKTGMFYCPNCKKDQPYKLMRYKRYFHLFFIPIFPIKDLGDGLECMNCHTSFVPNSVSFKEESDLKHIVVAPDLISPTSANFSKRVGAYIIDYILIYIYYT